MMWPRGRLPFAILALIVLGIILLVLIYIIWAVTLPANGAGTDCTRLAPPWPPSVGQDVCF
jgi:hypothetical protein